MALKKKSLYTAKQPDSHGIIPYTEEENETWSILYHRQKKLLPTRCSFEYWEGLNTLGLPEDRVPQCKEISQKLKRATGWEVARVPALIPFGQFFRLLADRKFPAASFIRTRNELDYLQEPDIFHEVFGHCPLLTDQAYADFMAIYGAMGVKATYQEQIMLARFYWFTVEFGLIQTPDGTRSYGAGILSSPKEVVYAMESVVPDRRPFDVTTMLRTPYRIDMLQNVYYVIDRYQQIYDVMKTPFLETLAQARRMGMLRSTYPSKSSRNFDIPMHIC